MSEKAYLVGTKQGAYITRALRRLFVYWPARREVRGEAFTGRDPVTKVDYFRCAVCRRDHEKRKTHVDHILPVVDVNDGITSWDSYIRRLFSPSHNLQVLCHSCHLEKTKREGKERRAAKRGHGKKGRKRV